MVPNTRNTRARRAVVGACLVALVAGGCSESHHSNAAGPTPSTTSQTESAARSTHLLRIGKIDIESAGRAARLDRSIQRAVLAIAQRYVNSAILAPLETGKLGREYATLFASSIRPAATGIDRSRLTDIGVGRTTTFTEASTPVTLSALTDQSGALLYTATNFNVDVGATTSKGRITISRNIELTLESLAGHWFIVAYRITLKRTAPVPKRTTPTTRRPRPRATTTTTRPRTTRKKPPKP